MVYFCLSIFVFVTVFAMVAIALQWRQILNLLIAIVRVFVRVSGVFLLILMAIIAFTVWGYLYVSIVTR